MAEPERTITNETLQSMIRDFGGFELTEDEIALVRPEIENYMAELQQLEELDLEDVFSSRLIRLIPKE